MKILHLMAKDTTGMNDDNLYYYYLLTLKAADKSFIPHTSDTLARRIVAHYEEGGDERLLPEVYYYAGRVYRDIGDAPQALDYFQKALDLMENDTTNLKLKSVVYSQMGYTAYLCNLYDKALEMHRGCYNCAVHAKDTVGMICGLMDMATCQVRIHNLDSAYFLYKKALKIGEAYKEKKILASVKSQLASLLYSQGLYEEALSNIRYSLKHSNPQNMSPVFCITADVFAALYKTDSALYYYRKILEVGNIYAKQDAYKWLSHFYQKKGKIKEALIYTDYYKNTLDSVYKITATEAVARMNSLYNYQIREKENIRLKDENQKKQNLILILFTAVLFSIVIISYTIVYTKEKRRALRFKLEKYEMLLQEENKRPAEEKHQRTNNIINSEIYGQIRQIINDPYKSLRMSDELWEELSCEVKNTYPNFDNRLRELCKMSVLDYRVCLLIKIGANPTDIAHLTFKSKSGIGSIRRKLYERAFGKKGESKDWDNVIYSL